MTATSAVTELEPVEFTFDWYRQFLEWLRDAGYTTTPFADGIDEGEVLLRHDVDLSPRKALAMARLEADLGFSATYFFLVTSPLYNVLDAPNRRILEELTELGHRVALHFNPHQYWRTAPTPATLRERVDQDRSVLSTAAPVASDTVSVHCPPDWALNQTFDGIRTTYEPRFFSEIKYVADSGQRWRNQTVLGDPLPDRCQVLTHPGLWGTTDEAYIHRVTIETQTNLARAERYARRELLEGEFEAIDYPYGDILPESPLSD